MKTGAIMACVWGVLLALMLNMGMLNSLDPERAGHLLPLIATLLIVTVGIPAFRDPELRNAASMFYLVVGVILIAALAALLAFALIMFLLSGWKMTSHN